MGIKKPLLWRLKLAGSIGWWLDGKLTLGGDHFVIYTDVELYCCTPETYSMLYRNFYLNKKIKCFSKLVAEKNPMDYLMERVGNGIAEMWWSSLIMLNHKESWVLKNWCFWTVVLEKTLESPLDSKEIKPVNSKGNQFWIFIGKTDAEAESPVFWPPDVKNWLIGKDPDAGQDWRQKKKGTTEDEMVDSITDLVDHWPFTLQAKRQFAEWSSYHWLDYTPPLTVIETRRDYVK